MSYSVISGFEALEPLLKKLENILARELVKKCYKNTRKDGKMQDRDIKVVKIFNGIECLYFQDTHSITKSYFAVTMTLD